MFKNLAFKWVFMFFSHLVVSICVIEPAASLAAADAVLPLQRKGNSIFRRKVCLSVLIINHEFHVFCNLETS